MTSPSRSKKNSKYFSRKQHRLQQQQRRQMVIIINNINNSFIMYLLKYFSYSNIRNMYQENGTKNCGEILKFLIKIMTI